MTKARAALIIITAPKEADVTCFWNYFKCYPISAFEGDPHKEIFECALSYLEDRLEKISD